MFSHVLLHVAFLNETFVAMRAFELFDSEVGLQVRVHGEALLERQLTKLAREPLEFSMSRIVNSAFNCTELGHQLLFLVDFPFS